MKKFNGGEEMEQYEQSLSAAKADSKQPKMYDLCESIHKEIDVLRTQLEPVTRPQEAPKVQADCSPESPIIRMLEGIRESLMQMNKDIYL